MKIAVTGHTYGLGKGFFDFYLARNHDVYGYSRKTGVDLRDWGQMQAMLDQVESADLFINNAKPDFVQTVILYELVKRWQDTNKQIINIGSAIINRSLDDNIDLSINMYKTQKHALQNAFSQLFLKFKNLDLVLVHPGHLYDIDQVDYQKINQWIENFENLRANARHVQTRLGEIYL